MVHLIFFFDHCVLTYVIMSLHYVCTCMFVLFDNWDLLTFCVCMYRGGSRDFKGGVHNQRYTCIHHTECPSLEGDSKSGMVTQIK